jgi:hypothetical protein
VQKTGLRRRAADIIGGKIDAESQLGDGVLAEATIIMGFQ